MTIDPKMCKREELEKHSVDMRQFIDFRQSILPNGMRIIEAYNGSGLTFTILPDRGMDIWTAHYKGIPLTWISQGSPHPPDFGQTWLQQFNGGLLTTCGLTHVGPPEKDDVTGEFRDLHGRYSRLRANVEISMGTWHSNEQYFLELNGQLSENKLFGEQISIRRLYMLGLGQPEIQISTFVSNRGDTPVPLMLLYHFNLGFPLIREGTEFLTTGNGYPRDDTARTGLDTWASYEAGSPHYAEQVFFHHGKYAERSDSTKYSLSGILNDDLGLQFRWHTDSMPYLTQWKNTRQGIYVSGIEPGNCIPEGQNAARHRGRLVMLEPQQTMSFVCELLVLDGKQEIETCRQRISLLEQTGKPIEGCRLENYSK
jgi:hypothetical protein